MSLNKSILYTFLTQIPTQLLAIISGVFITRILGPEGKGIYAIFLANIQLFVLIFGLSLNTAIVYFINSKKLIPAKLLGVSIIISLLAVIISTLIIGIIVLLNQTNMLLAIPFKYRVIIAWLFVGILFTLLFSLITAFLQAYKYYKALNQLALINSSANIIIYGTLMIGNYKNIFDVGILGIIVFTIVVLGFNTLIGYLYFIKKVNIKASFDITYSKEFKPLFNYIKAGYLSQVINFFNYRLDLWIMNYYLDQVQIGFYSLATGISNMIFLITTSFTNVVTQLIIEQEGVQRKKSFQKYSQIHTMLILIICVFLFYISFWAIPFLYGVEFQPSIVLFKILLPGIVFASLAKFFSIITVASDSLKLNLKATIVGLVATISLDLILIPRLGGIGAAITSSITYFVIFGVLYSLQIKKRLLGFENYFIYNFTKK